MIKLGGLVLAVVLVLGACGSRSGLIAGGEDAGPDPRSDSAAPPLPKDAAVQKPDSVAPANCPGDPGAPVCDLYPDGLRCPAGARRTVIACRPLCQDRQTCAEVPPLPAAICASAADCLPGEFCQADGLCLVTGAIAGTCQPRPDFGTCPPYSECPSACGCNGETYCDVCQAHAAGVSVATSGACLAPTCAGLQAAYVAELQQAKTCCPTCAALQCMTVVPDKLACGCDTHVNVETATLRALREQWQARGCMVGLTCPAVQCAPAAPGECHATSAPAGPGSGRCTP